MRFLSIDVETSGLEPYRNSVLEIAMAVFSTEDPSFRSPVGRIVMLHPDGVVLDRMPSKPALSVLRLLKESFLAMEQDWFASGHAIRFVPAEEAIVPGAPSTLYVRSGFLAKAICTILGDLDFLTTESVTVGGKNPQFDISFLKAAGAYEETEYRLSRQGVLSAEEDFENAESFVAFVGDRQHAETLLLIAKQTESEEQFFDRASREVPHTAWSRPWRFRHHRRLLDAGNFWVRHDDECVPSLAEVASRAGITFPQVPDAASLHSAVIDCIIAGIAIAQGIANAQTVSEEKACDPGC
jgi:hypothetical protein